MKKNVKRINESQLKDVIYKSIKKMLKEGMEGSPRYYVDFYYVDIKNGQRYGDLGYAACDLGANYSDNLQRCIESIRESLNEPMEEEYEMGEARSKYHPNPRVIQIIKCNPIKGVYGEYEDIDDKNVVYTFANCSEDVARNLGIKANEYIETYNESYTEELNESKNMRRNAKRINENQLKAIVAESVKKVLTQIDF